MAKKKSKNIELTEEQIAGGVTINKDGEHCLHGLNGDQMDEMNELGMGLEAYKKMKEII